MRVSVILPYFGEPIPGCVESIQNQTYPDVELIKISERELGITERKGAGFMRNEGAKLAHGDILFFMDSDATLMPDAIANLVDIFQQKKADAVSCLPLVPPRSQTDLLNYLLGLEYEVRIAGMGEGWVDVAATTGLGVTREAFDAVDGFVTAFARGTGEDWIFSQELVQKGYKIWHSNRVGLYHYTAETFRKYLNKQAWHAGYRVDHYRKYGRTTDSYTTFLPYTIALCNLPLTARLLHKTRAPSVLLLPPLTFVRNIVWLGSAALVTVGIFKLRKGS